MEYQIHLAWWTVFPHPSLNEIPYLFPDLIAHIPYYFYMKSFYLQRIFQNIGYAETYFILTIWIFLWSYSSFLFLNWVIFSTPSKTWNSLHFPDFLTHIPTLPDFVSQFPTFSGSSKKKKSDSWLFQDFPYPWEPWMKQPYHTFVPLTIGCINIILKWVYLLYGRPLIEVSVPPWLYLSSHSITTKWCCIIQHFQIRSWAS